jgi:LysM repeat protein
MKIKYNKVPHIFKVEDQTLEEIASMFDLNPQQIKAVNKIQTVKKGQFLVLETPRFYTVKPLDTFEKIAQKLDVTKEHLMQKNSTKVLFIGQILVY